MILNLLSDPQSVEKKSLKMTQSIASQNRILSSEFISVVIKKFTLNTLEWFCQVKLNRWTFIGNWLTNAYCNLCKLSGEWIWKRETVFNIISQWKRNKKCYKKCQLNWYQFTFQVIWFTCNYVVHWKKLSVLLRAAFNWIILVFAIFSLHMYLNWSIEYYFNWFDCYIEYKYTNDYPDLISGFQFQIHWGNDIPQKNVRLKLNITFRSVKFDVIAVSINAT